MKTKTLEQYYVMFSELHPDGVIYKRGERPEVKGFTTTLLIGDKYDAELWQQALATVQTESTQLKMLTALSMQAQLKQ